MILTGSPTAIQEPSANWRAQETVCIIIDEAEPDEKLQFNLQEASLIALDL